MTAQSPELSVVITSYKEKSNIFRTIKKVKESLEFLGINYEIIIIDDASPDNSYEQIKGLNNNFPRIKTFQNARNLGFVNSAKKGFSLCSGSHFWLTGGDCPYVKKDLIKFFSKLGLADVIIPYYIQHHNRSFLRIILSNVYTKIINLITGCGLKYYNGSSIYKSRLITEIFPLAQRFSYSAEILLTLIKQGCTFIEVEMEYYENKTCSTALRPKNFFEVVNFFFRLFLKKPFFNKCHL